MAHHALQAVGHVVRDCPGLVFLLGFLAPLLAAYWVAAIAPYRYGRPEDTLAPRDLARPAVPGVLERYATWEWATESALTPFGIWLYAELGRQNRSLVGLAQEAGMDVEELRPLLRGDDRGAEDPVVIRRLAYLLGASETQIGRLLQVDRRAGVEANRHP
jgi:hypothetical protein